MQPLYKRLAGLVDSWNRCVNNGNTEWEDKHYNTIQNLVKNKLPSGSGFDSGTRLHLDESTGEKLVFCADFHHMDDNGYYSGWSEHTVIVKPSLQHGFTLRITGNDRNDIKQYIGEVFHNDLSVEVDQNGAY